MAAPYNLTVFSFKIVGLNASRYLDRVADVGVEFPLVNCTSRDVTMVETRRQRESSKFSDCGKRGLWNKGTWCLLVVINCRIARHGDYLTCAANR